MFRHSNLTTRLGLIFLATVLLLAAAPPAYSQPPAGEDEGIEFSLSFMPEYQGETDLDRGGDFSVWRFSLKAEVERKVSERLVAGVDVGYALDDYSFSGATALGGGEPWEDIHRLTVGNTYRYRFSDDWSLFARPSVELALESGGDWDDALVFGAIAAVSRRFGPDLTVGAGLGAETGIEETDVFPVLLIMWQIREGVRLGNPLRPGPGGPAGLELVFSPAGAWEYAVGGSYRSNRFRLDGSGFAPDGVGEDEGLPFWVLASRKLGDVSTLVFYGGAVFAGELTVEDKNGNKLASDDYDPAAFIGFTLSAEL
jgi:hypothetical protein